MSYYHSFWYLVVVLRNHFFNPRNTSTTNNWQYDVSIVKGDARSSINQSGIPIKLKWVVLRDFNSKKSFTIQFLVQKNCDLYSTKV